MVRAVVQVNYILIAVTLGLLLFVCRSDRRMLVVLLSWACTLYILLLVNEFALWYIALAIDFALYTLMYSSEPDSKEEEEEEEEEEETEEGESEEQEEEEGEAEEEDETAGGESLIEQQELVPAAKSQPVTFRESAKRASVMLNKLQL